MKLIPIVLACLFAVAASGGAVSWDQSDPVVGWNKALPAATAAPVPQPTTVSAAIVPPLPQVVKDEALQMFKNIASRDPGLFGLSSVAGVNASTIGLLLPEYFVDLKSLSAFRQGQDPRSLLTSSDRIEALVESGSTAHAVILFKYSRVPQASASPMANHWAIAGIEGGSFAQTLESQVRAQALLNGPAVALRRDLFLIAISPLGSKFLCTRWAGTGLLGKAVSLTHNAQLGLDIGDAEDLGAVFTGLSGQAQTSLQQSNGPIGGSVLFWGRPQLKGNDVNALYDTLGMTKSSHQAVSCRTCVHNSDCGGDYCGLDGCCEEDPGNSCHGKECEHNSDCGGHYCWGGYCCD